MVQTSHAVHAIQHKKRHPEKAHLCRCKGTKTGAKWLPKDLVFAGKVVDPFRCANDDVRSWARLDRVK